MNGESSRYDKLESMLEDGNSEPHNVPLKYLRNITNNFSDERLLGEGGFGTVYKGVLQNGKTIAVKKLNSSMPGVKDRQFENEANHLMRLKHPNVVLLVGWCSDTENIYVEYNGKYVCAEKSEGLLCLEYMPKGNLRGYLSDEFSGLGWDTGAENCRLRLVKTLQRGENLDLHNWSRWNILSHGFKVDVLMLKRRGYMSPEYINRGLVSTKSDIFSLGVIIIEKVTGCRDYPDDTGTPSKEFVEMVLHNWSQRKRIKDLFGVSPEVDYQQIRRCIQIGLDCVKTDRFKRPTISKIIKALHSPESADSSNIKGVHGPQSGKRDRNCGETSWMERPAKKYTPDFSMSLSAAFRSGASAMRIQYAFKNHNKRKMKTAAARIQSHFRTWQIRRNFMNMRRQAIKIQAAYRGHQVRRQYHKAIGVVEKAILRWKKKRKSLHGIATGMPVEMTTDAEAANTAEEDYYQVGRQQAEDRFYRSVVRAQALFRSHQAQEYRRMKVAHEKAKVEFS